MGAGFYQVISYTSAPSDKNTCGRPRGEKRKQARNLHQLEVGEVPRSDAFPFVNIGHMGTFARQPLLSIWIPGEVS